MNPQKQAELAAMLHRQMAETRVESLYELIKNNERHVSDAEWSGELEKAKRLQQTGDRYRDLFAAGKEWEPSF